MKAQTKDLRSKSKEIIQTLLRGEEVSLTYHGKSIARIIPHKKKSNSKSSESKLFGIWSDFDETEDVEHFVRDLRKERKFHAR